ncbi:hypothetical protein GCM10010371_53570 [Streptomyces subrutilus]|uniref:Uncharacterized protein n=1 Tax=Streptomyces subrutilus TaxID=36818 RepID=A0A918R6A8_9ACTN|nr:hypothetical protein GCM10010371_53570 [Streptomyces subrutilus]
MRLVGRPGPAGGGPAGTPKAWRREWIPVLNGTGRQIQHGDVPVMLTNGRITANTTAFAKDQRLHLVDRHPLTGGPGCRRAFWTVDLAIARGRGPLGWLRRRRA